MISLSLHLAGTLALTTLFSGTGHPPHPSSDMNGASEERTLLSIEFDARVDGEPFTCGVRYEGVGSAGSVIEARDLRLYVSEVKLLLDDGTSVPLELEQDGLWQHGSVALLDFEDGTAGCRNGNEHIRTTVTGSVPTEAAPRVAGVRFQVGVPMPLNHINQAAAPSPLSLTSMFWSWNAGYKFIRAEVLSDGLPQGFFIHLGSTGCTPEGRATRPATHCANGNRVEVEFPAFDPTTQQVIFDLAALLRGVDLSGQDVEGDRSACMSGPGDARCGPIFQALGLPFGDQGPGAQGVFTVDALPRAADR